MVFSFVPLKQAAAQIYEPAFKTNYYEWLNRSVIIYRDTSGNELYRLSDNLLDYDHTYMGKDTNGCDVAIEIKVSRPNGILAPISNPSQAGTGQLAQQSFNPITHICLNDGKEVLGIRAPSVTNVAIQKPENFNNALYWVDAGTIATTAEVNTGDKTETLRFVKQDTPYKNQTVFLRPGEDTCKDFLLVKANNTDGYYETIDRSSNSPNRAFDSRDKSSNEILGGETCYIVKDGAGTNLAGNVKIGQLNRMSTPAGEGDLGSRDGSGAATLCSDAGVTSDSCNEGELNIKCHASLTNPLSWFACPIIAGAVKLANGLNNALQKQLTIDVDKYMGNDKNGKAIYGAWSNFRYFSIGIIVVIALIMVISTAFSIGPFEAYTVKRIMPRLVFAVVAIALSWTFAKFMITLANDLGELVKTAIIAPFDQTTKEAVVNGTSMAVISAGMVGVGILLGLIGALSFAVTGLLAVITAFAVIAIRNVVIIFLAIVSPLAIASYVLPNTQKIGKLWWDAFSKGLMMFPLIMGFIYTGRVFASVAGSATGSSGAVSVGGAADSGLAQQFIVFVAFFAPYFLLPATFRFAGGAVATLGGFVNDRSKGMFDRLKKGRQERVADRYQRAKNESLWNPNNPIAKKLHANKFATWAVAPGKNAAYEISKRTERNIPFISAAGRRLAAGIEESGIEESKKLFQKLNEAGANDKTYRALGGLHSSYSSETRAKLAEAGLLDRVWKSEKDILAGAKILEESDSATEQLAGNSLRSVAPTVAGLYRDAEMNYANVGAASVLGLAAHGFAGGEDLAEAGNRIAEDTNHEFAQAALVQAQLAGARSRPDIKAGYGFAYNKEKGTFVDGMSEEGGRARALLTTINSGDIAMSKGGFLQKMGGTMEQMIREGQSPQGRAAAQWVQLQREKGLSTEQIKKLDEGQHMLDLADSHRMAAPLIDELVTAAGPYSQASTDTKAQAMAILQNLGMQDRIRGSQEELERRQMEGGVQPPPDEGNGNAPAPGS